MQVGQWPSYPSAFKGLAQFCNPALVRTADAVNKPVMILLIAVMVIVSALIYGPLAAFVVGLLRLRETSGRSLLQLVLND